MGWRQSQELGSCSLFFHHSTLSSWLPQMVPLPPHRRVGAYYTMVKIYVAGKTQTRISTHICKNGGAKIRMQGNKGSFLSL